MRPENPRLPGVEALRRRCSYSLAGAVGLLPVAAMAALQIGVVAALGALALVVALLVLWGTSRDALHALEAIDRGHRELREVEQRWQFALEGAGHGVYDWNPITGRVYRSDEWHRLMGYSREEIDALEDGWSFLVHPEDRGVAREFRENLASGGHRSAQAEYRIRHGSGQWRWVLTRGTVFSTDAQGRVDRVVGTTTDLTEIKIARQQARDSLELFRAMFEESAYPMVLSGVTDRRISMVNRAATQLFRRPASELVGHSAADLGLFPDAERFGDQLRTQGRVRNFLSHMNGRSMLVFGDVLRLRGEAMCLIYGVDVTDRERSAAAERRVHELQRALFEHSPLPMAVLDADDFRVADVNQAALACFGFTRAEALGKRSAELRIWIDDDAQAGHLETLRSVGHVSGVDRRIRTRQGAFRDMQMSAELIEAGGERLVLVQFSDVTERRQAEAELARLNQELDQRVRSRTEELQTTVQELESFSYSVAHDLRAPLRAINAYLQLGADPALPAAEAREYLRKAAANAASLAVLIDDLLEFARAGRRTLERSLVDMDKLVRGVIDALTPGYPNAEIVVRPLPPVAGDAFLLRQALHNLLDNALKFSASQQRPRVEVFAEESARAYVYRVRDNGVGFDMKYSGNIFGVFQRLHDQREFAGTGVGLAIVKRIVERHNGRVWCESRPGEGATFSLSLATPEARGADAPTRNEGAAHGNPAR